MPTTRCPSIGGAGLSLHVLPSWTLNALDNMQAEELVITRLRRECGAEYTAKMQRMFTGPLTASPPRRAYYPSGTCSRWSRQTLPFARALIS